MKADPLRIQFETLEQQSESATLGVWVFLATEVLFFGGLFLAYAVYRSTYPIGVALAAVLLIGGFELLRELGWLTNVMSTYFGMTDFDPTQYRGLLFGLAMVVMMVVRPRGFVSTRSPSIYLERRTAVSGDLVKEGHG